MRYFMIICHHLVLALIFRGIGAFGMHGQPIDSIKGGSMQTGFAAQGSIPSRSVSTTSATNSMITNTQIHSSIDASNVGEISTVDQSLFDQIKKKGPLKVLFLSSDTGGGHRASAESLGKQFQLNFPGSTYDLCDVWTLDGCLPYRKLVDTYKHLSAHPFQWKFFYHMSNTVINEKLAEFHSRISCERKIRRRIASYDPDVVVSVHPTMNTVPIISTKKISKKLGKHIPFFTVVTDLGSGHSMWFHRNVERIYIASERIRNLTKRRGRTPDEKIVMSGLPIRHDFAVQAEKMGDRTTEAGKEYQKHIREELGLDTDKRMILLMGGGEGVGSLGDIAKNLYKEFANMGIDATICVICGRNEKLKESLQTYDFEKFRNEGDPPSKRRRLSKFFGRTHRSKHMQESLDLAAKREANGVSHSNGNVVIKPLGFITNMAEYMVAADVLVTKAGPGTIAEAAAVGLPVMLTSFLPGQEAGNVEVVLETGFGDFNKNPEGIAVEIACWLQDDSLLEEMSQGARKFGHPHAATDIVLDIGDITHDWLRVNNNGVEQ